MRGRSADGRGRFPTVTSTVGVTAAIVAATVLTACGDIEEQSLCTTYGRFLDNRAAIAELEAESLDAADAEDVADAYLATVLQLQERADGRYGTELDALESAVDDVRRTLASVPDDEDYAVWAPLVEDSLEEAANAAAQVVEVIGPSCPS